MRSRFSAVLAAVAISVSIVGCGSDDAAPKEFAVRNAWARPTPADATIAAVYLTITTDIDDVLVGASVPADIAFVVTLHPISGEGGEGHEHHGGSGTDDDLASMSPPAPVPLAAGETFEFSPGGNHIMMTNLQQPLTAGSQFPITLVMESGRTLTADVVVSVNPP